jgi:cytochrome P450
MLLEFHWELICVIALRLLPPIPANLRVAMRDTWLPTGGGPSGRSPIFVARGDAVSYVVNSMHQRKDIFGEDAEEFRPERWQHLSPGWGFLPFNGGPRICLGQQYSLTSAMYTVARMAQTVRRLEYRGNGWVEGLRIGYYNAEGVPVTIQKVDNGE